MSEFEHDYNDNWSEEWAQEKSKTQVKKELQALKDMGKALVELSARDLDKLVLPDALRDEVNQAQSMSKGALKRQLGYIGGLIAEADYDDIGRQLTLLRQPHQGQVKQFHQLENWRDRLLKNDDEVYAELIATFPTFDVQHVRQLVRNASREAQQTKPPKSARQLFQYLQDLQQAQA